MGAKDSTSLERRTNSVAKRPCMVQMMNIRGRESRRCLADRCEPMNGSATNLPAEVTIQAESGASRYTPMNFGLVGHLKPASKARESSGGSRAIREQGQRITT